MVMCCSVMVPFFLAQWEETVTHILRTNVGGLGAVVCQWGNTVPRSQLASKLRGTGSTGTQR
jgi:hypothetical protein